MAAPTFVAAQTSVTGAGGTGLTIAIPAGASAGNRLLLVVSHQSTTPGLPTLSAGWTLVRETTTATTSGGYTNVWTAVATSGGATDPGATVTITFPANSKSSAAIVAYSSSDVLASAIDQSNPDSQSTVTTPTASSLVDTRVVHIYGTMMNGSKTSPDATVVTWTPHASTTERADIGCAAASAGSGRQATVMVADEEMLGGGTSTARTATPSEAVRARSVVVLLGTSVAQPTANAGPDQSVAAGATVNLDGSASGGAGAPFTYQWTQTSGTAVTLNDATAENPSFTAPATSATLVFSLVVQDSASTPSPADTVTITVAGPEDIALPNADVDITGWTPSTGSTAWQVLSDGTDATWVTSPENPTSEDLRVGLSTLTDPANTDTVILRVRARRQNATSATVSVQLVEGASTVRATLAAQAISAGDTFTEFTYQFSPAEIDGVVSWADVDAVPIVTAA